MLSRPHFATAGLRGVSLPTRRAAGVASSCFRRIPRITNTDGNACARCHEIGSPIRTGKPPRTATCRAPSATATSFTLDAGFHINNMRRVFTHLRGDVPDQSRGCAPTTCCECVPRCRTCHQQEFAEWQSGAHSATYTEIFLDPKHNHRHLLMDDCLRCHGMHFEGGIRDLVTPLEHCGPLATSNARAREPRRSSPASPATRCIARASPWPRPAGTARCQPPTGNQRPSLALFDRRELAARSRAESAAARDARRRARREDQPRPAPGLVLPVPRARRYTRRCGSGDDRTPIGVHEGLSCFACHQKHGQQTRASCATCHPAPVQLRPRRRDHGHHLQATAKAPTTSTSSSAPIATPTASRRSTHHSTSPINL